MMQKILKSSFGLIKKNTFSNTYFILLRCYSIFGMSFNIFCILENLDFSIKLFKKTFKFIFAELTAFF